MIVKQSYGAQGLAVVLPLLPDELLADHVSHELGAVAILAGLEQLLQPLKQGLFDGKTQSGQIGHRFTVITNIRIVITCGLLVKALKKNCPCVNVSGGRTEILDFAPLGRYSLQ